MDRVIIHKLNSSGRTLCKLEVKGHMLVANVVLNVTCKDCLNRIEIKAKKTIKQIENKVAWTGRHNMPTTQEISDMLHLFKIPHTMAPCPKPPKGRKPGMKLTVLDLIINPAEHDYSEKNWGYANRLLEIIEPSRGGK